MRTLLPNRAYVTIFCLALFLCVHAEVKNGAWVALLTPEQIENELEVSP